MTQEGAAFPESEKLIIISNYFGVSLDYLLKDDEENSSKETNSKPVKEKTKMIVGVTICITGIVSMVVWGLLSIFRPETSNQISNSSMIAIDGNGILLIASVVAIIVGASLLLKNKKK